MEIPFNESSRKARPTGQTEGSSLPRLPRYMFFSRSHAGAPTKLVDLRLENPFVILTPLHDSVYPDNAFDDLNRLYRAERSQRDVSYGL